MKKIVICAVAALACALPSAAKKKANAQEHAPVAVEEVAVAALAPDSVSIAVGTSLGDYVKTTLSRIAQMGVVVDNDTFVETMRQVLKGQPTGMSVADADRFIQQVMDAHNPNKVEALSEDSQEAFIKAEAAKEGAVTTPGGVVLQVITEGEGEFPKATDTVKVAYVGRLYDGKEFDNSHGEAVTFPLNGVVPGFSEGIQHMRPGGKYRIIFPASMGYGSNGIPGAIPGNAALDFTVDLLEIVK